MNAAAKDRSAQGRLVLVEDDDAVRAVLTLLLESDGWQVIEAADGTTGLEVARGSHPDVVVTDLRMPGLSGLELAARLEAAVEPDVPVVAITTDASDLRDAAERSGRFFSVLTKPLAPQDLLDTVRSAAAD